MLSPEARALSPSEQLGALESSKARAQNEGGRPSSIRSRPPGPPLLARHPDMAWSAQKGSAHQAGNPRRDHFEKSTLRACHEVPTSAILSSGVIQLRFSGKREVNFCRALARQGMEVVEFLNGDAIEQR